MPDIPPPSLGEPDESPIPASAPRPRGRPRKHAKKKARARDDESTTTKVDTRAEPEIPPEIFRIVFEASSKIAFAAAVRGGYHPDAAKVLPLDATEQQQLIDAINPALGEWDISFGKYPATVTACMSVIAVVSGKLMLLQSTQKDIADRAKTTGEPVTAIVDHLPDNAIAIARVG